jgi:hypothetical protein
MQFSNEVRALVLAVRTLFALERPLLGHKGARKAQGAFGCKGFCRLVGEMALWDRGCKEQT